ncbi:hypothetical protein [Streptomyces sp. NPDC058583]|uniref:hypothetical protein n=1 Tax=unclassified Streptomyces TaxID=2593676 RepID=UPI003663DC9B
MNRRTAAASWPEREALHDWLREAQGELTFVQLAKRSAEAGRPVSERTLRRAFEAQLPKEETVRAYAGAWEKWASAKNPRDEADQAAAGSAFEARGLKLLSLAVSAAPAGPAPSWPPPTYVPGPIRTWPGLTKGLKHLHKETGSPSLRMLAASPGAAGRLSKSTISNILSGKPPTLEQLTALLSAYRATRETTDGMLAAYWRIVAVPEPPAVYPCDIVERAESEGDARLVQEKKKLRYRGIGPEAELDWYEEQVRDAKEAEWRRLERWVDSLSDEELAALNHQAVAAPGRDLRGELIKARDRLGEASGMPPRQLTAALHRPVPAGVPHRARPPGSTPRAGL